jgi:hypothetical protein
MPKSIVDRVNFIGRDQPIRSVFLDRSGNPIGDGDADNEEDPANLTANLPGEVIPRWLLTTSRSQEWMQRMLNLSNSKLI